mgnify:FL=1
MRIWQCAKEESPRGKDYWVPAEIGDPKSSEERDTKRIPISAFLMSGGGVEITADNGDIVELNAFFVKAVDGKKMYRIEISQK